jgi:hypothetical protein
MKLIDGALGVLKIVKQVMSFIGEQSKGGASGTSSGTSSAQSSSGQSSSGQSSSTPSDLSANASTA